MSRNQRLVLLASISGSFVAFLDIAVVNVALPAIQNELGGGLSSQQWVVDAYLLTLGSFILIAGSLSDLFGRKRVFATGLAGLALVSALCAVAPSDTFLIAARAAQGVFGALLVPSSLAMLISHFSGPNQGKAIGTWTAWTGIAFVVGPLLGGALVDASSWRWIFAINVILAAFTLLILSRTAKEPPHERRNRVDFIGALLCALGLGGIIFGLIEGPVRGWGEPSIAGPLIGGGVLFLAFLLYERSIRHPMLELGLFRNRNFAVGNLATVAIYAGLTAAMFLIVVFLQQVAGFSALGAGLSLLPVTIIMFGLSPLFGKLAGQIGPRFFMGVGPLVAGAGFLLMSRISSHVDYAHDLLPGVLVFGLGLALTVAPLTAAILADIDERHAGTGSAINNAIARVAGLFAVAAIGAIIAAQFMSSVTTHANDHSLGERSRSFVDEAKGRPFDTKVPDTVRPDEAAVSAVLNDASVDAFREAMLSVAALLALGGLVSALGIKNPPRKRGGKSLST